MAEWRAAETAVIEAPLGTPEYERAVKLADDTRTAFIACLDAATSRNGPETQEAALAAVISPPLPEAIDGYD